MSDLPDKGLKNGHKDAHQSQVNNVWIKYKYMGNITNHRANSYNKWIENSIEGFNR